MVTGHGTSGVASGSGMMFELGVAERWDQIGRTQNEFENNLENTVRKT